jgi:hypothetical protein
MLRELNHLPEGILDLDARDLIDCLDGPSLIHLDGAQAAPLFVSVLMHGNETVGWESVRQLLARYDGGRDLPRAMSLFVGNITAAAKGLRRLPGQPDYNRVWPGSESSGSPEHGMMQRVVDIMRSRSPFASIDVHNNTGINPHYACVNRLESRYLHLASLFGRIMVYFLRPKGVASMAMAQLCPSVTLECGKVGQLHGVEHALDYLDACLHLSEIPGHHLPPHDVDLFHTVAQVKVPEEVSIGFTQGDTDICFLAELDHMNFRELPAGFELGSVNGVPRFPLEARDERGMDVSSRYFSVEEGRLYLRKSVMPSMLTRDEAVIRQDCLCYLMERYNSHLPG